ncbi:YheC/YheD family endospore coat-associated protein [Bacillus sp. KH172YL63]|uniref:YheC/YheD family endospore coat-associated protein n=1 Tax=Bacillus sp. KH172YL63 TaxID=2709784 RepID=UPI0013E51CB4|nr:YheC/YheD family protein [Bacillus sp. KH172YL63]BCB02907.1 hypothetical protein KH172YL63_10400 [Bacillus sp. KH172YL63]
MNILYDRGKQTFFHGGEPMKTYAFAKGAFLLSSRGSEACYEFTIAPNHSNKPSIPLIGIVSSKEGSNKYKGNFGLFRCIQQDVAESGGICFVFSPQDIFGDSIAGIIYHHGLNKWVKCVFPVPNVIYNRVPSRHAEQHKEYEKLLVFVRKHGIPFFNPHFFNKWELHGLLSKNEELLPYLPATEQVTNEESFIRFLTANRKIYVKHTLASQGKGIRLIEIDPTGRVLCKSTKKIERFVNVSRLLQTYPDWFTTQQWIMQEAIQCRTLQDHRYDFRVLVLHTGKAFKLIGIGVRMSQRQEVTTHVPSGGKIISVKEVADSGAKQEIGRIVQLCGEELAKSFGYIGEFSIDIAPRETGGFVLFEINSKPMTFDEEEIENSRRQQLVRTFLTLSAKHNQG